jgi:hypothetical protein
MTKKLHHCFRVFLKGTKLRLFVVLLWSGLGVFVGSPIIASQLSGSQNFLVLRVRFKDMAGFRFSDTETRSIFDKIANHWGPSISYGAITVSFRIADRTDVPKNTYEYIGYDATISDSGASLLVSDALPKAPASVKWDQLAGLVILFADNRSGMDLSCSPASPSATTPVRGFFAGRTPPGFMWTLPDGRNTTIPVSFVGENPCNDETSVWGRIAHEVGHALQVDSGIPEPAHPSDYSSGYEQMDWAYPGQSGVFEKQDSKAFRGWLPASKYLVVSPPAGAQATILAEESAPSSEPDPQAIRATLSSGRAYYLISVRRRHNGDDLATYLSPFLPAGTRTDCNTSQTPLGIPDCGVLIERVVEGGAADLLDGPDKIRRWVQVIGNRSAAGPNDAILWHVGDEFDSSTYGDPRLASDGIRIRVVERPDQDHYQVSVRYGGGAAGQPDVELERWLQPPSNTYETTDIWIDSPLNGYAATTNTADPLRYRYGVQADLHGGVVPIGNGDDPVIGMTNRIYARVRNFGSGPATNVTVFFDITDPPGLGIAGSNGFKNLGQVGPADFPALASIPAGGYVDVFLPWKPEYPLTQQQIADGRFFFHTCLRVRVSREGSGQPEFDNPDGEGQQENVLYFDSTSFTPGTPSPPNQAMIHLRNDDIQAPKTVLLGYIRGDVPRGWDISLNRGQSVLTLGAGEERTIPITVKQNVQEPVGTRHILRVIASHHVTFTRPGAPPHDASRTLGGVDVSLAVLSKTRLTCSVANGILSGTLAGQARLDREAPTHILVVPASTESGGTIRLGDGGVLATARNGRFAARAPAGERAACFYGGSRYSTSSGAVFRTGRSVTRTDR